MAPQVRLQIQPVSYNELPDGRPVLAMRGGRVLWLVDGTQIDARLIQPTSDLGTVACNAVEFRKAPADDPWGEVKFVREDIGLTEMFVQITPSGIYLPLPRGLIHPQLADDITRIGTKQMRWYKPPTE